MPSYKRKPNDDEVDRTSKGDEGRKMNVIKSAGTKVRNEKSKAEQLANLAANAALHERDETPFSERTVMEREVRETDASGVQRKSTTRHAFVGDETDSEDVQRTATQVSSDHPPAGIHLDDTNSESYSDFETQPGAYQVLGPGSLTDSPTGTTRTVTTAMSTSTPQTELLSESERDDTDAPADTRRYDSITTVTTAKVVDEESERLRIMASAEQEIRTKILSQVVSADATPINEDDKSIKKSMTRPKRKRVAITITSVAIVVVAAAIVATILLYNKFKSKESPLPAPSNVVCEEAIKLNVGGIPDFYTDRGTNLTDTSSLFATCPRTGYEEEAPSNILGIWFTVVGSGLPFSVSTCRRANFDTQIAVFRGSDCGQLECIAFNDNIVGFDGGGCNYYDSSLTWPTVVDEKYYVLVGGPEKRGSGTFGLEIIETVENDLCETAIGPISTNGTQIAGSTINATPEGLMDNYYNSKGVWYWVIGTGKPLAASTCHSNTTFDTVLHVFDGDEPCDAPKENIAFNDNACHGTQSSVTWLTARYKLYLILVQGQGNAAGNFVLRVSEVAENDLCETAVGPLALPEPATVDTTTLSFVSGTTAGATEDFHAPSCDALLLENGPGVWFSVTGTGNFITASTCANARRAGSLAGANNLLTRQLAVYISPEGTDCNILVCENVVVLDPVDCGSTALAWKSQPSQAYYIHVHDLTLRGKVDNPTGSLGMNRTFELALTQEIPGSRCDYAIDVFTFDSRSAVWGSFDGVMEQDVLPSCDGAGSPLTGTLGVWYSIHIPPGSIAFQIDVCFSDATLYVFTGGCNNLECVVQNECFWSSESISNYGTDFQVLVSPTYDPRLSFRPSSFELIVEVQFDEEAVGEIPVDGDFGDEPISTVQTASSPLFFPGKGHFGMLLLVHVLTFWCLSM